MRFAPRTLFRSLGIRSATAGPRAGRARRPQSARCSPRLEALEARALPSTITVYNPLDSGPGSLRDALARAADGDTIDFSDRLAGEPIRLTSGELAVTTSVDIVGLGTDRLTVSGSDSSRVFHVAPGTTVSITGMTIAHGQAADGGGIANAGNLTVADSTLSDNKALGGAGGGAIVNRAGASLTLTRDLLIGNRATAAPMQDIFGGGLLNKGDATVTGSTFRDNLAIGGGSTSFFAGSVGGAIDNFGGATGGAHLTVADSVFSRNRAVSAAGPYAGIGGAIENNAGPNQRHGSTADIRNCTFVDNLATGGDGSLGNGGALTNEGTGATMTVTGSALVNNRSVGGPAGDGETALSQGIGGAILNGFPGATLTVTDSTLVGNQAIGGDHATITADNPLTGGGIGGGIANFAGGTAVVTHSTLIGNQAVAGPGGPGTSDVPAGLGLGGGIDDSFYATASISGCTLVGNQAIGGSGVNGGAGVGGGISVGINVLLGFPDQASVDISNTTLNANLAQGGLGSNTGRGGDGLGGGLAIISGSAATVSASAIEDNRALGGEGSTNGQGLGGGVYNLGTFSYDDLTTIRGNHASTSNDDIYP